jgi:RNA recognition motif-containing protein
MPIVPTSTAARGSVVPYNLGTYQQPPPQPYLPSPHPSIPSNASSRYTPLHSSKSSHGSISFPSTLPLRPPVEDATIFISGLDDRQEESHLWKVLKQYGQIVYLEIHFDTHNPGKNMGTARARYQTSSEATLSVSYLDGKELGGRKITVTKFRDGALPPTIPRSSNVDTSQRPLFEARNSSTKQKKSVAFSPGDSRSKRPQQDPKCSSKVRGERSDDSIAIRGPLVVNGAGRRGSQSERSEVGSDDSSEEDNTGDDESYSSSEEENYHVVKVSSRHSEACFSARRTDPDLLHHSHDHPHCAAASHERYICTKIVQHRLQLPSTSKSTLISITHIHQNTDTIIGTLLGPSVERQKLSALSSGRVSRAQFASDSCMPHPAGLFLHHPASQNASQSH